MSVWIVHNKARMDFSSAEKYGALQTVYNSHNPFNLEDLHQKAVDIFKTHGDANDWIILCGGQTFNVVACLAFKHVFNKINLLIYDARNSKYVPRELKGGEVHENSSSGSTNSRISS